MKLFLILPLFLLTFFPNNILAQTNALKQVPTESIDNIFADFDNAESPGCAIGINHHSELIFSKGYGMANLDYGLPLRPDSRFMIASISKQFAAAALLMLEQEGKLDLEADLRTYIPEISQFDDPITARQLIHHTSGIRDIFNLLSIADIGLDDTTTKEQALEMLANQKALNFTPGTRHLYSNMAYFLMSVVVERFSDYTLREYTDKHFFEPLGMKATHWHDDTEMVVPDRVISYLPTASGPGMFYRGNIDRVGDRGLFTTIEDFSKWDINFIENRTNLENFTEKMVKPGSIASTDSINYASGLRLGRYKSLYTVGHGGNYMGFRTNYVRFPDYDLGIFVFCNMSNINPASYTYDVADLYLEPLFEEILSDYTGRFKHEGLNALYKIEVHKGDLYMTSPFLEDRKLNWISEDHFTSSGWQIRFIRSEENQITGFTVESPRTGKLTFTKQ